MRFIFILILAVGVGQAAEKACSADAASMAALRTYLSWSAHWMDTTIPSNGMLAVRLAQSGSCTRMGLPSLNLSFHWCAGSFENPVGSCSFRQNGEVSCLQSGSGSHIDVDQIRTCDLSVATIDRWWPSPTSEDKVRLIDAIRQYTVQYSRPLGRVLSVIANDFRIEDPHVFAISEVLTPKGSRRRVFFMLTTNVNVPPYCTGSITRDETVWSSDGGFVESKLRKMVEVPLRIN